MHKEYINAKCIARSRGCTAPANAKLTSALSPRNAKSLKRVLSEEAKLSLYPSDSYPIHYTAGYPIYYARAKYIYRASTRRVAATPTDNFIPTREFPGAARANITLFLPAGRIYIHSSNVRIPRREWNRGRFGV